MSNTIALPGFNLYEALKVDDPRKAEWKDYLLSLTGRDLKGAVFDLAIMPKVDFTGVNLGKASLSDAQLQGARFEEAQMQGAILFGADLQGSIFDKGYLAGAQFDRARLQGTSFFAARFLGASLQRAQMKGADLSGAVFWGANLKDAYLEAANLDSVDIRSSTLRNAQLQGASFGPAQLDHVIMEDALAWRVDWGSAKCRDVEVPSDQPLVFRPDRDAGQADGSTTPWTVETYAGLRADLERNIPAGRRRDEALKRVEALDPTRAFASKYSVGKNSCKPGLAQAGEGDHTRISTALCKVTEERRANAIFILEGLIRTMEDPELSEDGFAGHILAPECNISKFLGDEDREMLGLRTNPRR